ncbi:MAG: phosphoethanolamine--lipid A transferase [Hyphomicrobium sp.]|nr:phosphoethanolamine--lipid A transferase [Hyphomicrobium sp.]
MLKARRPEIVTLAVSAFIVGVLNIPFWQRFLTAVAPQTISEWAFIAAVGCGLLLIVNLILTLVSNHKAFAILMAVLLPLTAAASYFMHEYGVVIDDNMVRNVFETNTAEAQDLFAPKMLAAIMLLGLLPALLIWLTPWTGRSYRDDLVARLKTAAVSVPLFLVLVFPFWGSVLSTFREHRELRLTLTPSNYISATAKYLRGASALAATAIAPFGEDAKRAGPASINKRKSLFVVVVGETARADHFSLNGYARPTSPELAKIDGLINYGQAFSCGTDTAQSVPCMFSGLGRDGFSNRLASSRENLLDILKRAGLDVIWRENQSGCKGVCARVQTDVLTGLKHPTFYARSENHDEILLDGLDQKIANLERDTVIVMHMMGSHGPAYWKRYPDRFEAFKPVCKESQFSRCTRDEIVNAYDNTILYTDYVLAGLAKKLAVAEQHNVNAGMLYMSDHGESLGENNIYLHGMPYAFAPKAQIHVPMVMWLSPGFRAENSIDQACMSGRAAEKTSHDALFHSVLGVMNVKTSVYDASLDLFAPCRRQQSSMQ